MRLFAATMAGVFHSADAGSSWTATRVHESLPFCEVIAASPDFRRDQTLFVGGRNGLYRSQDAGRTWRRMLVGDRVSSLALSRELLLVGTEQDGILRSEDGGATFVGANAGLLELSVLALALSPEFERDGVAFAATPSGVYRTRNRGRSWRSLDLDAAVQCLCFKNDQVVLAGTESNGLLRSTDGGTHWETVVSNQAVSVTALTLSRDNVIAAATDAGIAISHDGGSAWQTTASDLGEVLTLSFAPTVNGEVLVAGLHRNGIARAAEPFERWTSANDGLEARLFVALAFSPAFTDDRTLFAVGPDDGLIRSTDAGRTWTEHLVEAEDPAVFAVAVSPEFAHDRSVFAATQSGVLRSTDAGTTWEATSQDSSVTAITAARRLVVAETHRLLASDDAGETWCAMGEPFSGQIVSVACAPDGTWFVGTHVAGELTLWRSADDGEHFERWLVEPHAALLPLAVSSAYAVNETVYVGLGSRVLTPMRSARETRSGEHRPLWRSVDLGAQIAALAAPGDAASGRVVFAATSGGVYVSRQGGERFSAWQGSDGPAATVAVAVSPDYARDRLVYALEVGGVLWRRRDDVE
jgi:photosystem II stability/assembly factor-like uncharacterized protein